MPTYPKMLPWLAKNAGVAVPLAEKLWRRAVGDAADYAGVTAGPEFHRFALERFIDLLEDECSADVDATRSRDWYWRHQRRMAALSFRTANLGYAAWEKVWKKFSAGATFA